MHSEMSGGQGSSWTCKLQTDDKSEVYLSRCVSYTRISKFTFLT